MQISVLQNPPDSACVVDATEESKHGTPGRSTAYKYTINTAYKVTFNYNNSQL